MNVFASRVLIVSFLLWVSCSEHSEIVSPPEPIFSLSIANLPHLDHDDGNYELWATFLDFNKSLGPDGLMHDEGFMSLGAFNISPGGDVVDLDGHPMHFRISAGEDAQLLDDVVVSIERHSHGIDTVEGPGPIIAGGKFRGDEQNAIADISITYLDAFGTNFSAVTGAYTLTAPSSDPADSNSGVWFFEQNSAPTPGLRNLPSLPEGWTYEGWAVNAASFLSTGKFTKADSADFDGAGPGKGPGNGLNFPGQDFIVGDPARPDLSSLEYWFMITVEPSPDNASGPFFFTLLSNGAQRPASRLVAVPMTNVIALYAPAGQVVVQR
ncbi:MAG: hypothetical protein ACKVRP_00440 [Bacteroidota bacterium]